MISEWVAWTVLIGAAFAYGLTTLALTVLQPQSVSVLFGIATNESPGGNDASRDGDERAATIVLTTFRTATIITIVISATYAARAFYATAETATSIIISLPDDILLSALVGVVVLIVLTVVRIILSRLANACYEQVVAWLTPMIWTARLVGRWLRLNRVHEYMHEPDSSADDPIERSDGPMNLMRILSQDLRAEDVMMPVSELVMVRREFLLGDVHEMMSRHRISEAVIHGDSVHNVLGVIQSADILQWMIDDPASREQPIPDALIEKFTFQVPHTLKAANLLEQFAMQWDGEPQPTHIPAPQSPVSDADEAATAGRAPDSLQANRIAVVIDEAGKVCGIVPLTRLMARLWRDPSGDDADAAKSSDDASADTSVEAAPTRAADAVQT